MPGGDTRQDTRHQDKTGNAGMEHRAPGWDRRWDRRSQEETGGVRMGYEEPRRDRSHQDVTPVTEMGQKAPGGDIG